MKTELIKDKNLKRKEVKEMKKIGLIFLVLLLVFGISASAWAYPLPANFKMKLADVESFTPSNMNPAPSPLIAAGDGIEDNWGIANITQIFDNAHPFDPAVWNTGNNGEYLRLVYWGLDITSWLGDPGGFTTGPAVVTAGGVAIPYSGADIYLWDSGIGGYVPFIDAGPAARIGYSGYPGISTGVGPQGVLQASLDFATGIGGPADLTIGNTFGLGTNPPTGQGAGYLDVIHPYSGSVASTIDTNGFPTAFGARDLYFQFNFRKPGVADPPTHFELYSEDPILGHAAAIPEPSTIILLGTGLLGLGGFAWRRAKK